MVRLTGRFRSLASRGLASRAVERNHLVVVVVEKGDGEKREVFRS